MITIWRYPVVPGKQTIRLPVGAEILAVQATSPDEASIWACVNSDAPKEERTFVVYGTGHDAEELKYSNKYIGTFQLTKWGFVFHLFELI